ncbi:MAG: hypothetical protein Q8R65_01015 [Polynucleobacter sp.]|nr:hypothetical protein [Polynucleobacter sp.]
MSDPDKRCCGSGVCIINAEGECWCGQKWDGSKMSHAPLKSSPESNPSSGGNDARNQNTPQNKN